MWEEISEGQFVSSCLNRFDDCLTHETSSSPRSVQDEKINTNRGSVNSDILNVDWSNYSVLNHNSEVIPRKGYLSRNNKNVNFQDEVGNSSDFNTNKVKLHSTYKHFLNMDRVMPWISNIDYPQKNYLNKYNFKNDKNYYRNDNYVCNLNSNGCKNDYFNDSRKILNENRNTFYGNIRNSNLNTTSPVKSDISTSTSSTLNPSFNEKNMITYDGNGNILGDNAVEYNNYEQVPPLVLNAFNNEKKEENYYYLANNLFNVLSPSWILCIDIAAVLLTNTDNKMALSNIGPKLSFISRDALRQIKQKKLSRFIKEHSSFFDIRRPSPNHSALYVTLKFPLPSIMQQFLPKITELRKYESERNQYNIFQSSGYYLKNMDINSNYSLQNELEKAFCDKSCLNKKKLNNEYDLSSASNEFVVTSNKSSFKITQIYNEIPTVVRSFQMYECWLCVREFATVLVHQPTHTMELREIGVLMSQKARIQAKRNSSKKNYKSFLLCYPKLFRIFGKDDNHSIQWIGSHQDFIKLSSIKYQPPQTDDELFNIPTLNESHSQFLFNLNNCSVSLK
ncbi:hypothetical protein FG379_001722 [Cryptosporidium bovis]|uniref:uncharacterized protein n=1 Tax=Cryptosporidium bovis TaxID=310047 RepID=UPI00351A69DC|nr:hypothetical protein FG379_001722 [Cryptosporidium bovis]